jgi:hypothetical protein
MNHWQATFYLGAGAGVVADDTKLAVGAAGQAFDTAD